MLADCDASGCCSESLLFLGWKLPVDDDGDDDDGMMRVKVISCPVLTTRQDGALPNSTSVLE